MVERPRRLTASLIIIGDAADVSWEFETALK
jgi:hypothetical protein